MSIRIHNFMGRLGWNARKYLPMLSSQSYLKLQFITRRKLQKRYIDYFLGNEEAPHPLVVNIETINRCNSTCAFCTANVHAEKRPLMKIEDELYYSIIDQLADWGYRGHLTLYGNNEPWLDTRIVEFHEYARSTKAKCPLLTGDIANKQHTCIKLYYHFNGVRRAALCSVEVIFVF